MNGFISPIDYVSNKCLYCIKLSKQRQVLLEAQDINTRMAATLIITNAMLKQHNLTTEGLVDIIYRQIIHEGNFKKYLLRHEHDTIFFCFNYPKCAIKEISFSCEWATVEEATIKVQKIVLQTLEKYVEARCRSSLRRCEKQLDSKMEKLHNTLKEHFKEHLQNLTAKLNYYMELKFTELANFSAQTQTQQQEHCKRSLKEVVQNLIDRNSRYFDEFKLIKNELQASISICHSDIQEISGIVNNLKTITNTQKDKEDKIKENIEDAQRSLNEFQTSGSLTLEGIKGRTSQTKPSQLRQCKRVTSSFLQEENCSQRSESEIKIETPIKIKSEEKPSQKESAGICT